MTVSWDLPSTIAATSTIGAGADIVSFSGTGSHSWDYNPVNLQFIFVEVDFVGHTTGTEEEIGLPGNYELAQNYPNPFNPNTKIQFQVPKTSNVNLTIYNMLGQEITTLFAGEIGRGVRTVEWDGLSKSGIPMSSGIYIYRIVAGEFIQSKTMVLMR